MATPPVRGPTDPYMNTHAQQGMEEDDLDRILNEALAEEDETSTTTTAAVSGSRSLDQELDMGSMMREVQQLLQSTTAATSASSSPALPMPDLSHFALSEAQRGQQIRLQLMKEIEEYRKDPVKYRGAHRATVAVQKMMENLQAFETSGIFPLPPNNPSGNQAIRIFEDRMEERDAEEITASLMKYFNPIALISGNFNPATLASQVPQMLSQQSAIYDRLVREGKAEYLKEMPRSDATIDQELTARILVLSQFGVKHDLCQQMAKYGEFDLEVDVAETHALSTNEDLVPLYLQKVSMNPSVDYKILLDPELARLRVSFVNCLIENMRGK